MTNGLNKQNLCGHLHFADGFLHTFMPCHPPIFSLEILLFRLNMNEAGGKLDDLVGKLSRKLLTYQKHHIFAALVILLVC